MIRRLTDEEDRLWAKLRETVTPLGKRRPRPPSEPAAAKRVEPAPVAVKPPAKRSAKPAVATPAAAKPRAPAPIEERTLRRLRRGLVAVDARIDLHGMRQERAHAALAQFLRHEQGHGAKIVLVVTGKGRSDEGRTGDASASPGSEREGRGVLRQVVPAWLAEPGFRPYVAGVEEAHRRHGGAGALYVRIRRRREARAAG